VDDEGWQADWDLKVNGRGADDSLVILT